MLKPHTLYELADRLEGVPLLGCFPGSPSHDAGMRYGDILLEVNGQRVRSVDDYFDAKDQDPDGMVVVAFRDGREERFELTFRRPTATSLSDAAAFAIRSGVLASVARASDGEEPQPS